VKDFTSINKSLNYIKKLIKILYNDQMLCNAKENNFQLNKEDKLLLYCARTKINSDIKEKIISLVNSNVDWNYLIELASRNRLMPLLIHNLCSICPDVIPDTILNDLKKFFHKNATKNLLLSSELIKVMKLLEANDVNSITYKGPLLAQIAYRNIALRQFGDVDLFVDKSDVMKVKKLMLSEGYELYPPISIENSTYIKLDSEYRFNNMGSIIEVNWNFVGNYFFLPVESNKIFFDNVKKYKINNTMFNAPSQVNQLLILCIHCAKHNWNRLSWICDIVELIQNETIDWAETIEKAEKLGIKRILLINIYLANDLFGMELPKLLLPHMNYDAFLSQISIEIKKKLFGQASFSLLKQLIYDFRIRENKSFGLRTIIYGFTKPSCADYKEIKLPEYLFFLYSIIRPFLLIKRYKLL